MARIPALWRPERAFALRSWPPRGPNQTLTSDSRRTTADSSTSKGALNFSTHNWFVSSELDPAPGEFGATRFVAQGLQIGGLAYCFDRNCRSPGKSEFILIAVFLTQFLHSLSLATRRIKRQSLTAAQTRLQRCGRTGPSRCLLRWRLPLFLFLLLELLPRAAFGLFIAGRRSKPAHYCRTVRRKLAARVAPTLWVFNCDLA